MNSDKGFGLNMAVFDLNLRTPRRHTSGSHRKEMTHELGEDRLCSAYGFSAHIRIPSMRRALSRRLQGQDFFLLGPVSFNGLCPTHLQRKPARHRGLSSCSRTKALPHGDTREGIPEYAGQRQPSQRLAHLRGFRASAHRKGAKALCPRLLWDRPRSHRLCSGFHHNRSLSVSLPLGGIQKTQRGGEAPRFWISEGVFPQ